MGDWEIDEDADASYYQVSDNPVAYSIELAPLVVADYDESGNVCGIELLTASTGDYNIQDLIALAGKQANERREDAVDTRPGSV